MLTLRSIVQMILFDIKCVIFNSKCVFFLILNTFFLYIIGWENTELIIEGIFFTKIYFFKHKDYLFVFFLLCRVSI